MSPRARLRRDPAARTASIRHAPDRVSRDRPHRPPWDMRRPPTKPLRNGQDGGARRGRGKKAVDAADRQLAERGAGTWVVEPGRRVIRPCAVVRGRRSSTSAEDPEHCPPEHDPHRHQRRHQRRPRQPRRNVRRTVPDPPRRGTVPASSPARGFGRAFVAPLMGPATQIRHFARERMSREPLACSRLTRQMIRSTIV